MIMAAITSYSQSLCPTTVDLDSMEQQDPERYTRFRNVENFISTTIANQNGTNQRLINANGIITIPIVVHVLHRGEAIGTGRNISAAQIQSQIDVLNEDFRRLNPNRINTPAPFLPLAADFGFEFKLACTDPNGSGTNGIIRKYTTKNTFEFRLANGVTSLPDEVAMGIKIGESGSLPWPTDRYLNIWVCDFGNSYKGYSTFPADYVARPEFDGVVIHTTAMGREGNIQAPQNGGRTGTHEIGHWLGLNHLWGGINGICGNDFVADTPPQSGPNFNCPNFPLQGTCNTNANGEMFMNYMDGVNDVCRNLYTNGQKQRARAFFSLGGPRAPFIDNYFTLINPNSTIKCFSNIRLQNPNCLVPTWTIVSGPAIINSGQGTNEIVLQANGVGAVVLKAEAGNYTSQITINVNLDGPDPITGISTTYKMIHCTVSRYIFKVEGADRATNFKWSTRNVTQGTGFSVFNNSTNRSIGCPSDGSCDQIEVKVAVSNICSVNPFEIIFPSDMCTPFTDGSCSSGRMLMVSPNPSVSNVQLQLIDEPNVIPVNTQSKKIMTIKIVDRMGQLKRTMSGNQLDKMIIDLASLPTNIYTILVFDGKEWISKQINKN